MSQVARLAVSREYGETMPVELLVHATTTRKDKYTRKINDEERAYMNEEITRLTLSIDDTEDEKKEVTAGFNARLKEEKAIRKDMSKKVRTGMIEVDDDIHVFECYETMRVHEYNSQGERTATKRMKAGHQTQL